MMVLLWLRNVCHTYFFHKVVCYFYREISAYKIRNSCWNKNRRRFKFVQKHLMLDFILISFVQTKVFKSDLLLVSPSWTARTKVCKSDLLLVSPSWTARTKVCRSDLLLVSPSWTARTKVCKSDLLLVSPSRTVWTDKSRKVISKMFFLLRNWKLFRFVQFTIET